MPQGYRVVPGYLLEVASYSWSQVYLICSHGGKLLTPNRMPQVYHKVPGSMLHFSPSGLSQGCVVQQRSSHPGPTRYGTALKRFPLKKKDLSCYAYNQFGEGKGKKLCFLFLPVWYARKSISNLNQTSGIS